MHDPSSGRPATSLPQQGQQPPSQPPAYTGAVIPEKPVTSDGSSYLSAVGGYLADAGDFVSVYVPSALRKSLPSWTTAAPPPADEERERPSWSGFDVCELPNGQTRNVLCVAYATGFQVWDISDGQGEMREVLSRRESYPIKSIKFLPQPAAREQAHHPFYGRRPMFVVLSSDENPTSAFANSMMKVYSASTGEYANMVKFSAEIQAVQVNRRLVVVLLRAQLHAFDAVTMEQMFSFRTFPFSPPLSAPSVPCGALGPRFLAFASRDPPPPGANTAPSASALKDAATSVASGLAFLGEAGRRLLYAPPAHDQHFSPPDADSALGHDTDAAGSVQVMDITNRRVIAHWRAHSQPLSGMSWDPSGALLLTVSNEAHHFHVWLITPTPAHVAAAAASVPPVPLPPTYTHLYKLVRGVTGAAVQSLSWSRDSRWLAVSSGRGTTHLFALHPQGGAPSTLTHASDMQADPNAEHSAPNAPLAKPFTNLNSLTRLKPQRNASAPSSSASSPSVGAASNGGWDEDEALVLTPAGKSAAPPPFPVSSAVLPSGNLLLHSDGQLAKWAIGTHGPPPGSDLDPRSLLVDVTPLSHWDLSRRRAWPELRALAPFAPPPLRLRPSPSPPPSGAQPAPGAPAASLPVVPVGASIGPGESSATLWEEVELHTHAPPFRPLWAGPQCSLRATDMGDFFAPLSLLSASAVAPSLNSVLPQSAPHPHPPVPAPAAAQAAPPQVHAAPAAAPLASAPIPAVVSPAANAHGLPSAVAAAAASPLSSALPASVALLIAAPVAAQLAPIPQAVSVSPPAPESSISNSNVGGGNAASRKADKKKAKRAAAAAAAAAASPSPPAPVQAAPASPSLLRLDEPRTELPVMKLHNNEASPAVPVPASGSAGHVSYAAAAHHNNHDLRAQGIMSAMSTPLMAAQSPGGSPGSSPLPPPIIEFLRPGPPPRNQY